MENWFSLFFWPPPTPYMNRMVDFIQFKKSWEKLIHDGDSMEIISTEKKNRWSLSPFRLTQTVRAELRPFHIHQHGSVI